VTDQYGEFKRILQEVVQEVTEILNRMFHSFIFPGLLTPQATDLYRTPIHLHVSPASPVPIISHLERSAFFPANHLLSPIRIIAFLCAPSVDLERSLFFLASWGHCCSPFVTTPRRTTIHPFFSINRNYPSDCTSSQAPHAKLVSPEIVNVD